MAKPERIVLGSKTSPVKRDRSRQLRRAMTPQERKLWARLRRNQVADLHFRRQQVIDGFIVDFYCHRAALVIEIDGPVHDDQATTMNAATGSCRVAYRSCASRMPQLTLT